MSVKRLLCIVLLCSSVSAQYFVCPDSDQEKAKSLRASVTVQRYLFLEEHLSPPDEDSDGWADKIRHYIGTGVTYGAATIIAHVLMRLIFWVPLLKKEFERVQSGYDFAQRAKMMYETAESLPGEVMYLFKKSEDDSVSLGDVVSLLERKKKAMDDLQTFYNISWAAVFYVAVVAMNYLIERLLVKKVWTFRHILIDYVKNWPDYKMFTPLEYQPFLELLYLIYTARRNRLTIEEHYARDIVLALATHALESRQNLQML